MPDRDRSRPPTKGDLFSTLLEKVLDSLDANTATHQLHQDDLGELAELLREVRDQQEGANRIERAKVEELRRANDLEAARIKAEADRRSRQGELAHDERKHVRENWKAIALAIIGLLGTAGNIAGYLYSRAPVEPPRIEAPAPEEGPEVVDVP